MAVIGDRVSIKKYDKNNQIKEIYEGLVVGFVIEDNKKKKLKIRCEGEFHYEYEDTCTVI